MPHNDEIKDPRAGFDLIVKMIQEARGNIQSIGSFFLLWGWLITFCNLGMYAIIRFSPFPEYASWIWLICIPAYMITIIYGRRMERSRPVITHLDRILKWLWVGMVISLLPIFIFGSKINWMINAVVMLPIGLATFTSGITLRFKPLVFGGIFFWISSVISFSVSNTNQLLVGAVATIVGYLIPGYMLKKSSFKENV